MPSLNFFLDSVSEIEVQNFSVFPTWLPHNVTDDIIIINKTFYMSSHSNGENFVSIRQAVAEKNTKVLCRQTNRQTDKQTDRQTDKQANKRTQIQYAFLWRR